MATIYDDIPIIQDSQEQDSESKFLGFSKISSITKETIAQNDAEKILKQKEWMLTTVENAILKAAKEGQYSTTITVPADYSFQDCLIFLTQEAHYGVRQLGNRSLSISWNDEKISGTVSYHLFEASEDGTFTHFTSFTGDNSLIISKGTEITEEFIQSNFPSVIEKHGMNFELFLDDSTDPYGPSGTHYGTIIYDNGFTISARYLKQQN